MITLTINNRTVTVVDGTTVAAAILNCGISEFRRSVRGEERLPVCAMGICFECRVSVNGIRDMRSCTLLCEDGMEVTTDE